MKRIVAWLGMLVAFTAFAIEPPQPAAAPATPAAKDAPAQDAPPAQDTPPAPQAPPAQAATDPGEEELPPLPPDVATTGPPPQRFNPTEKVRADFPVSFPIDI